MNTFYTFHFLERGTKQQKSSQPKFWLTNIETQDWRGKLLFILHVKMVIFQLLNILLKKVLILCKSVNPKFVIEFSR